jgi:two-component system sensor histidine kinase ChvG
MPLRWQLLAVSLLTLALPWAGCHYAREMETVLRGGLAQSILESATTIARALDEHAAFGELAPPGPAQPESGALYAPALAQAPSLDGYRDDWRLAALAALDFGSAHRYWLGVHERTLYAFVELADTDAVYSSAPGRPPYGDRLLLRLESTPPSWLLLHTAAPGQVRAVRTEPPDFVPTSQYEDRVLAAWVDTPTGFGVELRIPLALADAGFGLAFIDVDTTGSGLAARLETSWNPAQGLPPLRYPAPSLRPAALQFGQQGRRLRLVDQQGWILFDAGDTEAGRTDAAADSIAGRLYRWILNDRSPAYPGGESRPGQLAATAIEQALSGHSSVGWYGQSGDTSAIVVATVPVRFGGQPQGALMLEQTSDAVLSLTDVAAARLVGVTALASSLAAFALLGYAALLSLRVRRLARGASQALTRSGEIQAALPGQAARDEIGDLARSFADLLHRVRAYNLYLRTLSSKLAHELRTPLAVVSTSIDNIAEEVPALAGQPYLHRLREGIARLDRLILSMSEATAIEQAVEDTPARAFALDAVVTSCVAAYRRVHPERRFLLRRADPVEIVGSAELIAQMLDKLVDNAVQFSPVGSEITVQLQADPTAATLSVSNPGPPLPESMRAQLFDSMVSVREGGDARGHLGLGLYIAALIARYHNADISARNHEAGDGVSISVRFSNVRRPL